METIKLTAFGLDLVNCFTKANQQESCDYIMVYDCCLHELDLFILELTYSETVMNIILSAYFLI